MKITFLMPCYAWGPSGGFRVVYEYASRLAQRGCRVSVVHPRRLKYPPEESLTPYQWTRKWVQWLRECVSKPSLNWQAIDPRVDLIFAATSDARHLPHGDVVFATGWHTVSSVMEYPKAYGEKCYLIQGYEAWQGGKEAVDHTWRLPLHKVVVSSWLREIGNSLGCPDITYIPNAIDKRRYRQTHPIEGRGKKIAMMFSPAENKGATDGIAALAAVKNRHPDVEAALFGVSRRPCSLPSWIEYRQDPPVEVLVREVYNRASIFLSASWSEGFALPVAEAASCGCAIVATDSGGVREVVEDGVSGLLSKPKHPNALANNLSALLENPDLQTSLAHGAKTAVEHLDWENSTDLMERFLRSVTDAKSGRDARVADDAGCDPAELSKQEAPTPIF